MGSDTGPSSRFRRRKAPRSFAVAGLLFATLLAGCHGAEPKEERLLGHETLTLGETLVHWSDEVLIGDQGGGNVTSRTLSFEATLGPGEGLVGVKLITDLRNATSRVTVTFVDELEQPFATVEARVGGPHYYGTIEDFAYILQSVEPGPREFGVRLRGEGGDIGLTSLTLVGIDTDSEEGVAEVNVTVPQGYSSLRVNVSGEGWGPFPSIQVFRPDGSLAGTFELDALQDDEEVVVPVRPGKWVVVVDARGYGGFLTLSAYAT